MLVLRALLFAGFETWPRFHHLGVQNLLTCKSMHMTGACHTWSAEATSWRRVASNSWCQNWFYFTVSPDSKILFWNDSSIQKQTSRDRGLQLHIMHPNTSLAGLKNTWPLRKWSKTCSTWFCFRGHLHMFKHVQVALCQVSGRPSICLEPYDDWTPNHKFPICFFSHVFFPMSFSNKTWSILKPSPDAPSKRLQRRAVPHFAALQSEDPAIAQLLSGTWEIPKPFEKWWPLFGAVRIYTSHTTLHILYNYTVYIHT